MYKRGGKTGEFRRIGDAEIRKERAFSFPPENSFDPYEQVFSVLIFECISFAQRELLLVVNPYDLLRLDTMHNFHLGFTRMLLRLTEVWLCSAPLRAQKPFNRIYYFLYEVDKVSKKADIKLDFSNS